MPFANDQDDSPRTFAGLLASYSAGDEGAADQLMRVFYPELRRMAAARLRGERSEHSWQPTILLHELYLELRKVKTLRPVNGDDEKQKAAFMSFAAHLMKRLLIHHARPLSRRVERISLDEGEWDVPSNNSLSSLELVLSRLGEVDGKLRALVEMKVFEGLSEEEIAVRLGCSLRTVARYWHIAKNWLQAELDLTE